MAELGRRGGRANGRPNRERVPAGLREYLRREVPPERIWEALEAAMTGENQAAKVSASKVLVDALREPRDTRPVREAIDMVAVRKKLATLLEREQQAAIEAAVKERTKELEQQLAALRAEHATA